MHCPTQQTTSGLQQLQFCLTMAATDAGLFYLYFATKYILPVQADDDNGSGGVGELMWPVLGSPG